MLNYVVNFQDVSHEIDNLTEDKVYSETIDFDQSYSLCPLHNTFENNKKITNSFKFSQNQYLYCRWQNFIKNLPERTYHSVRYPSPK